MIRFKIEGREYYIDDVMNIETYTKIYKVKNLFTEEYFPAKLLNAVCGTPMQDLLECGFEEITFLATKILELLPKENEIKFKDRFELNGIHYGFFPDWKELTFAEFIDMDTISTKKPDELLDLLHILAAIMYRPITEEISYHNFKIEPYDVDSMKKRAEIFKKELEIGVILGAQFFFTQYAKRYSNFTLPSLGTLTIWNKMKMAWMIWRMLHKTNSKKHLGGFWSSTKFVTMILQSTR